MSDNMQSEKMMGHTEYLDRKCLMNPSGTLMLLSTIRMVGQALKVILAKENQLVMTAIH